MQQFRHNALLIWHFGVILILKHNKGTQAMATKRITHLLFLLLLSLTLIACGDSKQSKQDNAQVSKAEDKTSNKYGKMIPFYEDQFSILKPKKWRIMDDLNDDADIQMGNLRNEAYAIVLTESKIDFDDANLQEYSDFTRDFLSKSLKKHEENGPQNFTINGNPAIKYVITGKIGFLKLKYWHVSIDTHDHFHQIIVWSLNSKFEKNQATYERVINSFRAN